MIMAFLIAVKMPIYQILMVKKPSKNIQKVTTSSGPFNVSYYMQITPGIKRSLGPHSHIISTRIDAHFFAEIIEKTLVVN